MPKLRQVDRSVEQIDVAMAFTILLTHITKITGLTIWSWI